MLFSAPMKMQSYNNILKSIVIKNAMHFTYRINTVLLTFYIIVKSIFYISLYKYYEYSLKTKKVLKHNRFYYSISNKICLNA